MTEAGMWTAIISILKTGLAANGLSDIEVAQSFQPTKQGGSNQRAVYLHKIIAPRVGHQGRQFKYIPENDNFEETERFWQSVHIQLLTQVTQDIEDIDSLTDFDIASMCATILQTRNTRSKLLESGISIENIKDLVFANHLDDKDEFDTNPSFDFILLFEQTLVSIVPKAFPIESEVHRVN
jgi:hypothetical protein